MEDDIQNYLSTVMFRGTPCISKLILGMQFSMLCFLILAAETDKKMKQKYIILYNSLFQANPSLTWRDIQHITVRNCHVANLRATDWRINAMGRNFSHSFGYGIMDASAMVRMAKTWTVVPEQKSSAVNADIGQS